MLSLLLLALLAVGQKFDIPSSVAPTDPVSSEEAVLISAYIPSSIYTAMVASAAAAASAASITGDPSALFFSAVVSNDPPAWFSAAVPSAYSRQMSALRSAISGLVATSASGASTSSSTGSTTGSTTSASSASAIPPTSTGAAVPTTEIIVVTVTITDSILQTLCTSNAAPRMTPHAGCLALAALGLALAL